MGARHPVRATTDVQQAIAESHLVPAERNEFGDAQAMAIGELDHRGIPGPMASKAFRGANEEVYLSGGEILAAPPVGIGPLPRWQGAVWGHAGDARRCPS